MALSAGELIHLLPGLDIAYISNGYVYHTASDTPDVIPPGCIQRGGKFEFIFTTVVTINIFCMQGRVTVIMYTLHSQRSVEGCMLLCPTLTSQGSLPCTTVPLADHLYKPWECAELSYTSIAIDFASRYCLSRGCS